MEGLWGDSYSVLIQVKGTWLRGRGLLRRKRGYKKTTIRSRPQGPSPDWVEPPTCETFHSRSTTTVRIPTSTSKSFSNQCCYFVNSSAAVCNPLSFDVGGNTGLPKLEKIHLHGIFSVRNGSERFEKLATGCCAFRKEHGRRGSSFLLSHSNRRRSKSSSAETSGRGTSLSGERSDTHSASSVYLCSGSGGHGRERRTAKCWNMKEKPWESMIGRLDAPRKHTTVVCAHC